MSSTTLKEYIASYYQNYQVTHLETATVTEDLFAWVQLPRHLTEQIQRVINRHSHSIFLKGTLMKVRHRQMILYQFIKAADNLFAYGFETHIPEQVDMELLYRQIETSTRAIPLPEGIDITFKVYRIDVNTEKGKYVVGTDQEESLTQLYSLCDDSSLILVQSVIVEKEEIKDTYRGKVLGLSPSVHQWIQTLRV